MKKKIIIAIIAGVFIIFFYCIYSVFYGNPVKKYLFGKSVKEYLELKYDEEFIVSKVKYSFKQSTINQSYYYAIVSVSESNLPDFRVYRDAASKELNDNVYSVFWDEQITYELTEILNKYYEYDYYWINNYIPTESYHEKTSIYDIPAYREYSMSIPINKRTDIIISIKKSYEDLDSKKISSIIRDIVDSSVNFNQISIDFINNNFEVNSSIRLEWDQAINIDNKAVSKYYEDIRE